MAARFWVGGAGTWDNAATTHWSTLSGGSSGASAPTSSDDVTFDTNSGFTNGQNVTIASTAACNNLTITGQALKSVNFLLAANFAPGGSVAINGNSAINRILIQSNTVGTARTLTIGTLSSLTNTDFQDITGAGAASPFSGTSIGDCQGNSGITFTTPATQTATGTASFNWSTHTWTTRVPLPQDNVVINNAFVAGRSILADMPRLGKNIDFTGVTGSPVLSNASGQGYTVFGDLTLDAGLGNITANNGWIFAGRGSQKITTAGKSVTMVCSFTAPGGTYTLQDNFTTTGAMTLNNGTLDTNSTTVIAPSFTSSGSTIRALTLGTTNFTVNGTGTVWSMGTVTNLTLSAASSTITVSDTGSNSKTLTFGGSLTLGSLSITGGGTGAVIVSGNTTFNTITINAPKTFQVVSNKTLTVTNFVARGSVGNIITINSDNAGVKGTLSKASGVVFCDYLSIKDSAATGGADWRAGANSTLVSNTSGWTADSSGQMTVADSFTMTDSFAKVWSEMMTASDTFTMTDLLTRVWTVQRTAADSFTMTDSVSRSDSTPKADTLFMTDSVVRSYSKVVADSFVLTDASHRAVSKVVGDTFTMTDLESSEIRPNNLVTAVLSTGQSTDSLSPGTASERFESGEESVPLTSGNVIIDLD